MIKFDGSQYSYGGSGRRLLLQVVKGGLEDPEQSGRVKCKVIGYDKDIPDEDAIWCRPMHPVGSAMAGGIGGPSTGATEQTIFYGEMSGPQAMVLTGVLGNSGTEKENGDLDQTGSNADTNPLTRDQDKGGGDYRLKSSGSLAKTGDWDKKSVTKYAKDEAPNPFKREVSKDEGDSSFTISGYAYA